MALLTQTAFVYRGDSKESTIQETARQARRRQGRCFKRMCKHARRCRDSEGTPAATTIPLVSRRSFRLNSPIPSNDMITGHTRFRVALLCVSPTDMAGVQDCKGSRADKSQSDDCF